MTTQNHTTRAQERTVTPQSPRIRRAQVVPPDLVVRQAWNMTGKALRSAMDEYRSTLKS